MKNKYIKSNTALRIVNEVYGKKDAYFRIQSLPAGNVVELPPVKMGDTAFFVIDGRIYEAEICLMTWHQYRDYTFTEIRGEVYPNHTVAASFEEFGKVVFLTREEAEEALEAEKYE